MDITLVLTHDCNLGCSYCYAGRKFRKVMPEGVVDRALDLAFANAPTKIQISYFGGEPLLEWDALVRASKEARVRGRRSGAELIQSVTTNGTLLTADRVRALVDLGIYVALSIDGNRAAHDANRPKIGGGSSWDDVTRGLEELLRARKPFETISVVTPASVRNLGASVRELFERGVPRVTINPSYESTWADEDLAAWEAAMIDAKECVLSWMRRGRTLSFSAFDAKIIARAKRGLAREDKCAMGEGRVAIAPSGNIYPCERFVAEDEDARFVIGHVDRGIDASRTHAMHHEMPDHHASNDECGSCVERDRCGAHCACANFAETGAIGVAGGVQCWYEQTTMRIADELADELLRENNEPFLRWFFPNGAPSAKPESVDAPHAVARKRALRVLV